MSRQKQGGQVAPHADQKPLKVFLFFLSCLLLMSGVILLNTSCVTSSPVVLPAGEILSSRGRPLFYFKSPEQQGRVRLNFFFELPAMARLEILNPLGGLESILWLIGEKATLYLTADRLVWQGEAGFILSQFLGGDIAVEDLACLLTGRVTCLHGTWQIAGEASGQTVSGRKENFSFAFKEYFSGSQVPRTIIFQTESYSARLRLQKMKFNQSYKAELFRPSFPAGAIEVSWEELSKLWKKQKSALWQKSTLGWKWQGCGQTVIMSCGHFSRRSAWVTG